jgi:hypothetical protein
MHVQRGQSRKDGCRGAASVRYATPSHVENANANTRLQQLQYGVNISRFARKLTRMESGAFCVGSGVSAHRFGFLDDIGFHFEVHLRTCRARFEVELPAQSI